MEPEIKPVVVSSFSPSGRSSAKKLMGRSPVAGMVKRKGLLGRTPKSLAPLILGLGEVGGVSM